MYLVGDLELLASNIHAIQSVKSSRVGSVGILIFGKSDTLSDLVRMAKKLRISVLTLDSSVPLSLTSTNALGFPKAARSSIT